MSNVNLVFLATVLVSASPDTKVADSALAAEPYGTVLSFDFEEDEDREPDGLPGDWNRRRGPGFPSTSTAKSTNSTVISVTTVFASK
jgi:hypothetical protein